MLTEGLGPLVESIKTAPNGSDVLDVIIRLHRNLLAQPENSRFHIIHSTIPKLKETLFSSPAALQLMEKLGWTPLPDGTGLSYPHVVNRFRILPLFEVTGEPLQRPGASAPNAGAAPKFVPPAPRPAAHPAHAPPSSVDYHQRAAQVAAHRRADDEAKRRILAEAAADRAAIAARKAKTSHAVARGGGGGGGGGGPGAGGACLNTLDSTGTRAQGG
eukprot:TRINITY_DN32791_c0_g1_i1.p1 TRINITY_DN32791_c0_g1~~TRINITY_DN32791_c0_g1_i1.p1  ORF type:complete len:216 (-),score=30.65 TRINITY_DN32791_c0_g1_i1:377-1024(-)